MFNALSQLSYVYETLLMMCKKKLEENWDPGNWPGLIENVTLNHC